MAEADYQYAILLQHKYEQEQKDIQLAKALQDEFREEFERKKKIETNSNDSLLARSLQEQFETEVRVERPGQNLAYDVKSTRNPRTNTKSLTDPSWEVIDPTPDIHTLFIAFNQRFFWNTLGSVCVNWSKRMTTCAGICSYQGRGGMCTISLSEPLLKLRPRKDLVETLLHEMIHAYLFITNNNRDRDGHGPEFQRHMRRINEEAGTNITIYHDFHDEVRLYQQHWWRCTGPCQNRKPYFGMVKRAMNRAPGPNDRWFAQHSQECGGTFIKVKEPEKPEAKNQKTKTKSDTTANVPDIRSFFPSQNQNSVNNVKTVSNNNNNNTSVNNVIHDSNNIFGFSDLNKNKGSFKGAVKNSTNTIVINKKPEIRTKQDTTTKNVPRSKSVSDTSDTFMDYSVVRNVWVNKFQNSNSKPENNSKKRSAISDTPSKSSQKQPRLSLTQCPVCSKNISEVDINLHLDECLNQQILDDDVIIENDKSFEDDVVEVSNNELKCCGVCKVMIPSDTYDIHASECLNGLFDKIEENYSKSTKEKIESPKPPPVEVECLACKKKILKSDLNEHLELCMNLSNIFDEENEPTEGSFVDENKENLYNCPVCFKLFSEIGMQEHIVECLKLD